MLLRSLTRLSSHKFGRGVVKASDQEFGAKVFFGFTGWCDESRVTRPSWPRGVLGRAYRQPRRRFDRRLDLDWDSWERLGFGYGERGS